MEDVGGGEEWYLEKYRLSNSENCAMHQQALRETLGKAARAQSTVCAVRVAVPVSFHNIRGLSDVVGNQGGFLLFVTKIVAMVFGVVVVLKLARGKVVQGGSLDKVIDLLRGIKLHKAIVVFEFRHVVKFWQSGPILWFREVVRGKAGRRVRVVVKVRGGVEGSVRGAGGGSVLGHAVGIVSRLVKLDGGLGAKDVFEIFNMQSYPDRRWEGDEVDTCC
jgi:hypothetical protein